MEYIAKLKRIRDQQVRGHVDLVAAFPRSNVREELPRLFSLYREIEELDRIIAAEEAKSRSSAVEGYAEASSFAVPEDQRDARQRS